MASQPIIEEGTPADFRVVRPLPATEHLTQECATDMVRSLFAQGAEFFNVCVEAGMGLIVADGWREEPRQMAEYEPPRISTSSGMAMDLSPMDRARLRNVVRRTHRHLFREIPTDRMCDELIDSFGPEVAARMVKQAMDARAVS